jgi:orotidine-5'-phosphate decarboxylase
MNQTTFFVALDFDTLEKMETFVQTIYPEFLHVKIGLELCTRFGVQAVLESLARFPGLVVFLDLKFHDIPNTVEKTINTLSNFPGIQYTTIHTSVGIQALERAQSTSGSVHILGVSVLTSMSEAECRLIYNRSVEDQILLSADLLIDAGCYGMVCSGREASLIRAHSKYNTLKLVCPGIRLEKTDDDQTRILHPRDAIRSRIDYLVVGRPITQSNDPLAQCREIQSYLHA